MSWLVDPATRALTTALDGYARREQAIASNIANIDTPGFRPSRVDFEAELAAAVAEELDGPGGALAQPTAGPSAALGPARTAEAHLAGRPGAGDTGVNASLASVNPAVSTRVDGNDVDIDAQMISLAETQLKYAATSRMLTGKIQMLKDVVNAR
jgi:flagellar basal-body rod protein FlgB